jgi:hypothetical protein
MNFLKNHKITILKSNNYFNYKDGNQTSSNKKETNIGLKSTENEGNIKSIK